MGTTPSSWEQVKQSIDIYLDFFSLLVFLLGNYDEDGYLRYFCKAGDGTVDVQMIADLHKSEVFLVAKELGVSQNILVAPPTADLWEGTINDDN
jgi:NAD+ synthase (glutamine-hydrolysing)